MPELPQHTCAPSATVMAPNDFGGHANSCHNSTAQAGVELQLECQESGQGTPRANMRGVKYVKTQRRRLCSAHPPCCVFFSFTVQQLGVLIADTILMYLEGKKQDEFL